MATDKKYFIWSLGGHIAIFLLLTVKVFVFPSDRPKFVRAVRVDLVALPEKNPIEAPKADKEQSVKEEPAPKKKSTQKKIPPPKTAPTKLTKKKEKRKPKDTTKNDQSNALARLKALNKIKKLKLKTAGEKNTSVYKGNILSEGNALTGVEKLQHDQYLGKLDQHIKEHWSLPAFLDNNDSLKAVLRIKFDENGRVISKTLVSSSGNTVFDQKVLEAVEQALPLPNPPDSLASYLKYRGIELRFPE